MARAWLAGLGLAWLALPAHAGLVQGTVQDEAGRPLAGVAVTVESGTPAHRVSVWSDADGRFATPPLAAPGPFRVQARRVVV